MSPKRNIIKRREISRCKIRGSVVEGGGVYGGEGEGSKVTKGRWGGGVTGGEDEVDVEEVYWGIHPGVRGGKTFREVASFCIS